MKVGDWIVIIGLSERDDYKEGEILEINGPHAKVNIEGDPTLRRLNLKYMRKIDKEVSKEALINASLDLNMRDWFMSLTGENNG